MKGVKKIYIVLIFILGLSIAFYPLISDQWNKYRANKLIANYDNVVKEIKPDEIKEKIDDARKYNETLIGGVVPDAFSVRNGVKDKEYESLLNINNDGITFLYHIKRPFKFHQLMLTYQFIIILQMKYWLRGLVIFWVVRYL